MENQQTPESPPQSPPSIDEVIQERDKIRGELEVARNRAFKYERMVGELKASADQMVEKKTSEQLQEGEKTLRQRLKALEEERQEVRTGAVQTALKSALHAAGIVDPVYQKHAAAILSASKFSVSRDMTSVSFDDGIDGQPIHEFVKNWLASDDGVPYRPQQKMPRSGPVGKFVVTNERLKRPIDQYSPEEINQFTNDELHEFHQKMSQ